MRYTIGIMKITEIESLLREASDAYYNSDTAIMSDAEFDDLRDQLESLDPANEFLQEVGSPTSSMLPKVKHNIPMGSLTKMKTVAELNTWRKSIPKTKNGMAAVSLKLDGLSIELVYKNGKFVQAITRGDGNEGEDVTHTIKSAQYYPKTITEKRDVSVRCEAMVQIKDWKKHFKDKANPRNTASGLVRRSDAVGSEHLVCVAFDVIFDDHGFQTEEDRINWLKAQKFKVAPTEMIHIDKVEEAIDRIEQKRDKLPVEIDGAVIKVDDIAAQEKLGEHDGRPKWARAWKFAAMGGFTTVTGVEWSVGTQGTVTPVAVVAPVQVGGVTIQNVSLHNIANVERLDVRISDEVEVIRANDVIPHIVRVVKKADNRQRMYCKGCPECGKKVVRDGKRLVCSDLSNCAGVVFKRISKWIKKRRILYLGDSTLRLLFDADVVRSVPDLYRLTESAMVGAGVGAGDANRILPQIKQSENCSLSDLIGSFSLDLVGRSEASNLVNLGVNTMGEWKYLTADKIKVFPGYQDTKANRIAASVKENWSLIEETAACLNGGNQPQAAVQSAKSKGGKLSGSSFCFTGTMSQPRAELQKMAADAGGDVHSSVRGGLTYLVMADPNSNSSKAQKARKLGITLISEDDFLAML